MNGILLIDKPRGWTSFDAVNKVRRLIQHSDLNVTGKKRFPVGHTGTLDPMTTGVLVLLLGTYTKKAPQLTKLDKVYEVTMCLGQTSTTGDEEGEKRQVSEIQPTVEEVRHALQHFVGDVMQTPPAYSAIKINGQRAYKLARAGREVKLEPRRVHIESIKLGDYTYPLVTFTAHVSSGTYIRSLVADVGEKLGTGAYMSDLRRTQVGPYDIADTVSAEGLTLETIRRYTTELASGCYPLPSK